MFSEDYVGRAGDELARKRLAEFTRYAALVEKQEAALSADDLDLFAQLGREIDDLQSIIGLAHEGEVPAAEQDFAAEAVRILEGTLARGERIRASLAEKRGEGAAAIRSQRERRPQARRYVAEPGRGPATRLDVTS